MNPAFLGYILVRGTVYKQINVGSCIHTRGEHRTEGVRCEQEGSLPNTGWTRPRETFLKKLWYIYLTEKL